MLLQKVNEEFEQIVKTLEGADSAHAPILATPAALVVGAAKAAFASAAVAKAAGAVVGAGAVTGAAYAAYRALQD